MKKCSFFITLLLMLFVSVNASAQTVDSTEFQGKSVTIGGAVATVVPNTWYVVFNGTRSYNEMGRFVNKGELPGAGGVIYDNGTATAKKKNVVDIKSDTPATLYLNYYVRFIDASGEGESDVYQIQFATGNYLTATLSTASNSSDGGKFNFYPIEENKNGHFGFNLYDMESLVNNNGIDGTLNYWHSGQLFDDDYAFLSSYNVDNHNAVWSLHPVVLTDISPEEEAWQIILYEAKTTYDANTNYFIGYGLITNVDQLSSPYTEPTEGSLEGLIDGNASTFWHSIWTGGVVQHGTHYLQVELPEPLVGDIQMTYKRRSASWHQITSMLVKYVINDVEYETAIIDLPYGYSSETLTRTFNLPVAAQTLRFYEQETNDGGAGFWHAAEFQLRRATLDPTCKNALYPTAAAALKSAIETAEAISDATQEDINSLRDALITYKRIVCPVTGIQLSETAVTIQKGQTHQLTATVLPRDAWNTNVIWNSTDEDVATVDENGLVTTVGVGTAMIIVLTEDNYKSAMCTVTVNNGVTSVALSDNTLNLIKGANATLTATCTPADADDLTLTWSSTNDNVATVDATGLVTAINKGTAEIVVTAATGVSDTCVVVVTNPMTSFHFADATYKMQKDSVATMVLVSVPEDADPVNIIWSSTNESVATVDENGVVTAIDFGTTIIVAYSPDLRKTAMCTLTVYSTGDLNNDGEWDDDDLSLLLQMVLSQNESNDAADVNGDGKVSLADITALVNLIMKKTLQLTLSETSLVIKNGDVCTLTASPIPTNYTLTSLAWTSSNANVATVDASGQVTGVGVGTCTITCLATDGSGATATCEVTVWELVLSASTLNLEVDASQKLTVSTNPNSIPVPSVTWTTSDDNVADVNTRGLVFGMGAGTCTITATATDGSGATASCTVNVSE